RCSAAAGQRRRRPGPCPGLPDGAPGRRARGRGVQAAGGRPAHAGERGPSPEKVSRGSTACNVHDLLQVPTAEPPGRCRQRGVRSGGRRDGRRGRR
ncbi:unnamed protein product, partial [Scytosiphon promiscuus]